MRRVIILRSGEYQPEMSSLNTAAVLARLEAGQVLTITPHRPNWAGTKWRCELQMRGDDSTWCVVQRRVADAALERVDDRRLTVVSLGDTQTITLAPKPACKCWRGDPAKAPPCRCKP